MKIKTLSRGCLLLLFIILISIYYEGRELRPIKISKVSVISQFPELPTGCEATAAAMLLKWAGLKVTKQEVAKALPKGNLPNEVNGSLIGGNPEVVFVGDPFSDDSYGVFHKPIHDVINKFLPGKAVDLSGRPFESLLHQIDKKIPVIVWATIGMIEPEISTEWVDSKGNKVVWKIPEHALLLTGFDDEFAYLNDPYTGTERKVNLQKFKDIWHAMGSQAVTIAEHRT